ncbi:MAG: STAS domain-containing protein [Actinomycetota bacterium]
MEDLDIGVVQSKDLASITLTGEFDMAAEDRVRKAFEQVESTSPLVLLIDLRGLTFVDSTGLRLLLAAQLRAEDAGRLVGLLRPPDRVHKVFCVAGLHERLSFVSECDLAPGASPPDRPDG